MVVQHNKLIYSVVVVVVVLMLSSEHVRAPNHLCVACGQRKIKLNISTTTITYNIILTLISTHTYTSKILQLQAQDERCRHTISLKMKILSHDEDNFRLEIWRDRLVRLRKQKMVPPVDSSDRSSKHSNVEKSTYHYCNDDQLMNNTCMYACGVFNRYFFA